MRGVTVVGLLCVCLSDITLSVADFAIWFLRILFRLRLKATGSDVMYLLQFYCSIGPSANIFFVYDIFVRNCEESFALLLCAEM